MANKVLIKGTFLDEISHDIPHQNWSEKEWSMDFKHMKSAGIDKVILIRSGYKNWITYPSKVLTTEENFNSSLYRPGGHVFAVERRERNGFLFWFVRFR